MQAQFVESSPNAIASVTQRWLFGFWNDLRAYSPLPLWSRLAPGDFERVKDDLCFFDVVPDGDQYRFKIRYMGALVVRMYGASCVGKFLDDRLPAHKRDDTLAAYRQAIAGLAPVYTASSLADSRGHTVSYERLILPFSNIGKVTARIIASLEAVSNEGRFDSDGLLQAHQVIARPQIRATIVAPPDAARSGLSATLTDDSDERASLGT